MNPEKMQNTLPVGTILKSPKFEYRIEEVLGQGGYGITYKVSATVLFDNVPVFTYFTVKEHFLKDACERNANGHVTCAAPLQSRVEESRNDFLGEARRLNSIGGQNPNVVPVSEVFEANGTIYYVMEYLNGGSLRDLVHTNGPLSEHAALEIWLPIAEAVSFLHSHKINHLDIKPDNIMFRIDYHSNRRMPVLIDFGLAKHFDEKGRPTTSIRMQGCSDGYAPVEQYSGLNTFSPQADVYALGAVLYYILVGKEPIIATEMQPDTVKKALPAATSDAVRFAIENAMAYNKADRTPSVAFMLEEICPKAQPVASVNPKPQPSKPTQPHNFTRQIDNHSSSFSVAKLKKILVPVISVLAVVAVIFIAISVWYGKKEDKKTRVGIDVNELFVDYHEKCEMCDSLLNMDYNGHDDALLEAQSLLDKIKRIEKSDEAANSDLFTLVNDMNLESRLADKLQGVSWAWKAAGEAQLDIPDYEQALDYFRKAYRLAPSDSLTYLIQYCQSANK